MEVRDVGPDYGREHSFHGLALPKRLAELRRHAADTGGLRLFQIPEVINVALGRHEQVPEVRGQISVERGHVEREDGLVINERSTRNVDVPRDLTTNEAVLVGHGRSVIESRQKAAEVPRPALVRCTGRSSGDERTRTADPLLAKQVLYRLSYVPMSTCGNTLSRVWHT